MNSTRQPVDHGNESLHTLFQIANDAMALSDAEGIVLDANPAYFQLYGFSAEEVLGQSFAIIYPSPQRERAVERYQRIFVAEATSETYESIVTRKDGSTRIVQSRASFLTRDGKRWAMLSVVRDITAQKRQVILQQFLIEAGKTLAASLDYETTLTSVANLATPQIADWCAIDLLDEQGGIQRVAVTHVNPEKIAQAYELHRRYPPSLEGEGGFAKVIRNGRSDYYPLITDEMLVAAAPDPYWLSMMQGIGFQSSLVVPLTARGRTFGVITLVTTAESGRTLTVEDVAIAEELGRIAALAVDNARLYEQTQSERKRLDVTLRSIGDAVITTDMNGIIELMNPLAQQMTSWTQEEALNQPIQSVLKLVSEDTHQSLENPFEILLNAPEIRNRISILLVNRNGRETPTDYTITPIKDQKGDLSGAVLVFRDISIQRQGEQERSRLLGLVEDERRRLNNILANVPGMVSEGILEGKRQEILFINDYAQTLLGYSAEELLSNPSLIQTIVHPDDLAAFTQQTREFYSQARSGSTTFEFRAITRTGRTIPIEAYMSVIQDTAGDLRVYSLLTDVSEREKAELALQQYARELKRSNEELEQFAYIASHDLQEPLRTVTSYLQLLERRYNALLDQDGREFIGFAVDGAGRMKVLISDLLTYSRVTADEREFTPFSTDKALKIAISNLQLKIEESQTQVIYQQLPTITGNENQFVQLFQNLMSNAIKFHGAAPPEIQISAARQGNAWLFAVRDNGIGMEQKDLERIFQMFQRLHARGQYPGTGIGLAVCKKVVEFHHGKIWAESVFGVGTTFYFTIPDTIP